MEIIRNIRWGLTFLVLMMGVSSMTVAQVDAASGATRDGESIRFRKDVPVKVNPRIVGNGVPTKLYVIQLARFEVMGTIPSKFPKGTFLYINPDHPKEKWLLVGFYDSYEDARVAAKEWKKNPMFKGAYARSKPFMVRYD